MIAILLVACSILIYQPVDALNELLPGLWIREGVVEFEGMVAINCHHPETPEVFLEMLVTAPDSREHESLVLSSIQPSALHAGLLAAGAEQGSPQTRDTKNIVHSAHGDKVIVSVAIISQTNGDRTIGDFVAIESWVVHLQRAQSLDTDPKWGGLVFAGSVLDQSGYHADHDGTLISLASFGNEVIAPTWLVSHQAELDEPVWIANTDTVPLKDTPVRIRLEIIKVATKPSHEPDGVDIDRDM